MKESRKLTKTSTTNKKHSVKNIWTKYETEDMFTKETKYIYENLYLGESFESDDPNLLEELNAKLKEKKSKSKKEKEPIKFDMSTISFKFNL